VERLRLSAPVQDLAALEPNRAGRDFDSLAKSVNEAIENNQPEVGILAAGDGVDLPSVHRVSRGFEEARVPRHGVDVCGEADATSAAPVVFDVTLGPFSRCGDQRD
jgi:hypothetical protein